MQRFSFRLINYRLIWGSVAGAFVAGVIFGLAQYLVRGEPVVSTGVSEPPTVSLMSKRDLESREKTYQAPPEKPEPPEPREKPEYSVTDPDTQPPALELVDVSFKVPAIAALTSGPSLTGLPGMPGGVPGGQGSLRGDGDVIPLVMVEPAYPPAAARRGQEGIVTAEFTVLPDGSVTDIVVVEATPRGVFEQAARRALAKWKFQPRQLNGRPIASRARQSITFSLKD